VKSEVPIDKCAGGELPLATIISSGSRFLSLALIFPFAMAFVAMRKRAPAIRAGLELLTLVLLLAVLSCGGATSSVGAGGGSNTYVLTVPQLPPVQTPKGHSERSTSR